MESVPRKTAQKTKVQPEYLTRKIWKNCIDNQFVYPLKYFRPQTLSELVEIVKIAEQENCTVRAVGSGHSFSEILQTTDFLINCHGLNKPIELNKNLLKSDDILKQINYDPDFLIHVENGITIKDLNKHLDKNNLALYNMGAYDAQTIVGVISTSTHGTGICLGPIASSVVSIVLVGEGGIIYRIEPTDGITDPIKYKIKFPENVLIQDDEWFNSILVSMGCMGIFYSVILKVTSSYYLKEERIAKINETYWEDVKRNLDIKQLLKDNRHFEIWINPYKIKGKHRCLMTKKNIYEGDYLKLPAGSRVRHWLIEFFAKYGEFIIRALFKYFYRFSARFIDMSLKQVIDYDGYIDKSFNVLHLGNANYVKGYSGEYAISLEDNLYIKAADKILELAEINIKFGMYHSAPISLRFVKQCDAYLSMMNGEDKCLIEVPILVGTHGGFQILQKIENEFLKLSDIRPHWGQYHQLNAATVDRLYPDLKKWKNVYNTLNQKGTFSNCFTERCGFKEKKSSIETNNNYEQPHGI